MRIIVVGAGIGGLAAALALARAKFEVEVVERAGVLREVGAGLQLSPNAMKALRWLGVSGSVEAVSSEPQALELRTGKSGGRIFSVPMGPGARRRYGAPYLHVHRADLLEILRAAAEAEGVRLRMGSRLSAFTQPDHEVRAGLDDGTILEADLLIGADGMRSTTRHILLGADLPRFTGAVAWRAIAPVEACPDLPDAAVVWAGPGRHAVTYRVRRGALINFVGVVEEEDHWREEGWDETGDKAELARAFEGWAPPVTGVIGAARSCHRWALFDRDPLPRWSDGRVTLLGDACHPVPPFLAQGAALALEDAVVLARCLAAQSGQPEAALLAYEEKRKARAAKVLVAARSNMGLFHRSNIVTQVVTYGPMRIADKLMPAFVRSRLDWIYAYDATRA